MCLVYAKQFRFFVIVLSCSYTFSLKLTWIHIQCASLSAHNRIPIHKPTQRQGVYKCIRVRTAPQPCYKGRNSLREFDDARRTHRRSPGGPSCTCSACSATARFGWGEQRKAHVDADVALPAHRAMSMLLSTIKMNLEHALNWTKEQ